MNRSLLASLAQRERYERADLSSTNKQAVSRSLRHPTKDEREMTKHKTGTLKDLVSSFFFLRNLRNLRMHLVSFNPTDPQITQMKQMKQKTRTRNHKPETIKLETINQKPHSLGRSHFS